MQICYEYASHMGPAGLMFEGFQEMYDSGHGCPDTDYTNLGYSDDPTPASIAKAKSSAREAETIDIWDPTAFQPQQQGEGAAAKAGPAPVQELETPQVKQTNEGETLYCSPTPLPAEPKLQPLRALHPLCKLFFFCFCDVGGTQACPLDWQTALFCT